MSEKENYIGIYVKKRNDNKPQVRSVNVADSGRYWLIKIKTSDNPTFEIDQLG